MQAYALSDTDVLGANLCPFFKNEQKNMLPSYLSGMTAIQAKTGQDLESVFKRC